MGNNECSSEKRSQRRSKKIKVNDANGTLCSGETTARIIPLEIIEEILLRLPVKSLLRFKCVAKSWLALISSPKFIKAHVKYSTDLDPTLSSHRLMISISYWPLHGKMSDCLVSFVLRDLWTDVVDGADFSNNQTEQQFAIHSSCNGLLCVSEYYLSKLKDVFLWNPCLRMSKKLPPPLCAPEWSKIWLSRCCIVYNERNDDYKVVFLFSLRENGSRLDSEAAEIYILKDDSWKRVEDLKGGFRWSFMVYANGKIHFVETSNGGLSIVSYDLENEVYGTVEVLGVEQQECYPSLSVGALKGCICALYSYEQDRADVWILNEYGVKESWTKLVTIPYVDGPSSVRNRIYSPYRLLFTWKGKYLLSRGNHLVVYDAKDGSFVHHSLLKGNLSDVDIDSGRIYVESLVRLPEMNNLVPLPGIRKL